MFKEKCMTKRKVLQSAHASNSTTLDARHQNMLAVLAEKQKEIDLLEEKLQETMGRSLTLKEEIEKMKANEDYDNPVYRKLWKEYMDQRDQEVNLEKQIADRKACKDEIEYYEKTASILFDYYSLLEDQSDGTHVPTTMPIIRPPVVQKKSKKTPVHFGKSILEQLTAMEATKTAPPETPDPSTSNPLQPETASTTANQRKDKSTLVDDYLSCMDSQQLKKINDAPAQECIQCKVPYIPNYYEGILYCPTCGQQEILLVEQNRPAMKQQNKETSHFSYKRSNHFNEWVSQIQGKESTDIPNEIFDAILNEIRKERITDPKRITHAKMREILKRLKMHKYYEHIPYIMNRIQGVPTPYFSPELEEKLRLMFKEIQAPFLRHCPKNRKNFLSYSYVLHKFFHLLGMDEYLKFFPLLKSREKLACQDSIWKNICEDLGWPFFPSV